MNGAELPVLTAGDLMSRDVKTVRGDAPLREAALQLARWGLQGVPVIDEIGRCVGVLSASDLARWISGGAVPHAQLPPGCSFQAQYREPSGRETILCRLPDGVCPFQRLREMPDGKLGFVCGEPHGIPTDWQVVELPARPGDLVRDFMTTPAVTAQLDATVSSLARTMLERGVHRLVVLDPEERPVGVVAVSDLLQVLAHPELTAAAPS